MFIPWSLLECWLDLGGAKRFFLLEIHDWAQVEGTALELLQSQAGDTSPENQFGTVHLTLPLTCGFQGPF